jgi:hypothetical protein
MEIAVQEPTIDLQTANRMKELINSGDTEHAHSEADKILCEVLRELGYNDLIDAYEQVDKWYA